MHMFQSADKVVVDQLLLPDDDERVQKHNEQAAKQKPFVDQH